MASSLILHKRITTTVAKAKALRQYVEPLLTKSKTDTTHSRRIVFSYLQNKESVKELFDEVSDKIAARPGGYTRIIKMSNRLGDNADMCIIELVDYNELMLEGKEPKKVRTRRSRRGKKSTSEMPKDEAVTVAGEEKKEKVETKVEKAIPEGTKVEEKKPAEVKAATAEKAEDPTPASKEKKKDDESDEKASGKE